MTKTHQHETEKNFLKQEPIFCANSPICKYCRIKENRNIGNDCSLFKR